MAFDNPEKERRQAEEQGQGLVEYALLLVLVAVVVIGVLMLLGPRVASIFGNIACALDLGSDIKTAAIDHNGSDLTVTVHVARPTTITISGDVSGGGACSGPTCSYPFSGVPGSGSLKVQADNGGCTPVYDW